MNRNTPSDDTGYDHRKSSGVIPVVEENLQVGIRQEETGRVRAIKKVHEENVIVSGPVTNEELHVERVPLNQYIDVAPPAVRYEGETMIIPVVQEEVVVQTRLVLVEEVRITKRQIESTFEKPVTLRKEEIIVERTNNEGATDAQG